MRRAPRRVPVVYFVAALMLLIGVHGVGGFRGIVSQWPRADCPTQVRAVESKWMIYEEVMRLCVYPNGVIVGNLTSMLTGESSLGTVSGNFFCVPHTDTAFALFVVDVLPNATTRHVMTEYGVVWRISVDSLGPVLRRVSD